MTDHPAEAKAMGDLRIYLIESDDRREAVYKAVLRTPGGYFKAVRDSIAKACAAVATQERVAAEREVGR